MVWGGVEKVAPRNFGQGSGWANCEGKGGNGPLIQVVRGGILFRWRQGRTSVGQARALKGRTINSRLEKIQFG